MRKLRILEILFILGISLVLISCSEGDETTTPPRLASTESDTNRDSEDSDSDVLFATNLRTYDGIYQIQLYQVSEVVSEICLKVANGKVSQLTTEEGLHLSGDVQEDGSFQISPKVEDAASNSLSLEISGKFSELGTISAAYQAGNAQGAVRGALVTQCWLSSEDSEADTNTDVETDTNTSTQESSFSDNANSQIERDLSSYKVSLCSTKINKRGEGIRGVKSFLSTFNNILSSSLYCVPSNECLFEFDLIRQQESSVQACVDECNRIKSVEPHINACRGVVDENGESIDLNQAIEEETGELIEREVSQDDVPHLLCETKVDVYGKGIRGVVNFAATFSDVLSSSLYCVPANQCNLGADYEHDLYLSEQECVRVCHDTSSRIPQVDACREVVTTNIEDVVPQSIRNQIPEDLKVLASDVAKRDTDQVVSGANDVVGDSLDAVEQGDADKVDGAINDAVDQLKGLLD